MIFDHDGFARYPRCFTEKDHRVVGMMEDIDKHDSIKACVIVWNDFTVETFYWNVSVFSDQDIQTAEVDIDALFTNHAGNQTVPTANV
jgi:hypothetical protein